jgi:hypothetical protein
VAPAAPAYFDPSGFRFRLPQRAAAALRALSLRSLGLSLFARALPPLAPILAGSMSFGFRFLIALIICEAATLGKKLYGFAFCY